ncbi:hypothetical protein PYCC9005_004919 [Savitreella phatthalungensis]
MANTILSCAVWCELHGPVNIFCTQAFPARAVPPVGSPVTATSSGGTSSSPGSAPSSSSKGGCASCLMSLPAHLRTPGVPPHMQTTSNANADDMTSGGTVYSSKRHPSNGDRYKALRSACIRALSSEAVPGRSGPVFFGDPTIGYTIAYIFRLTDPQHAKGASATSSTASAIGAPSSARRQYALMCTTTDEHNLLQSWTFVTERFKTLSTRLVSANSELAERLHAPAGSGKNGVRTSDELSDRSFLRPKGRAQEKGLAELTGMEDVFVQLHAAFAWMLDAWRHHFEVVRTTADTDDLVPLHQRTSSTPTLMPDLSHSTSGQTENTITE